VAGPPIGSLPSKPSAKAAKRAADPADVARIAAPHGMVANRSHMTREALQRLFARASARRAERRRFVETLRAVLAQRDSISPTLLLKCDRRRVQR
jgi:hypothetical protein